MAKTWILVLICTLIIISSVSATGSVKVAWADEYVVEGSVLTLLIDVSNIDMNTGLSLMSSASSPTPSTNYIFNVTMDAYDPIALNAKGGINRQGTACVDSTTGQVIAFLTQSTKVTFPVSEGVSVTGTALRVRFKQNLPTYVYGYGKGRTLGEFSLKCPIRILGDKIPQFTGITAFFYDDVKTPENPSKDIPAYYATADMNLAFPTGGFRTPSLQLTSVSLKGDAKSVLGSTKVQAGFKTDTPGMFVLFV